MIREREREGGVRKGERGGERKRERARVRRGSERKEGDGSR